MWKVLTAGLAGVVLFVWPAVGMGGEVVEYFHLDALGNIRAVTNEAGQVIERHDYLPFGEEWNPQPGNQPLRFTGKERDTETGFDYFGARYYGSKIGRFTTVDPVYAWRENLVDPQRWNRYAYARNNPLRYVDPDGKVPVDTIWDIGNVIFDVYTGFKTGNWSDLGMDLAATAVPYLPAGASKLRHLGKVDDAVDLLKAGDKAGDAARLGGHGDDAAKTFDQARREAFERAGMTDPSGVQFTKVDPKTGTVVEFKGPGGAKVAYDGPHPGTPGAGHATQHVGWQSAGKRGQGGAARGNIPYAGPQHPSRSPVKGEGVVDPH